MTKSTIKYDVFFIIFLAIICHLLFSKYGFNPTDEGFVLSATNRVLHGQIPHLDFSSVRPLGYAYLHIPELLFSKNYVFLISRLVFWLEQVLIAYFWILFLINYTKTRISLGYKYTLITICFIFNVHYFPCSVLHTIDGLLMCMIGLNFLVSEKKWNYIGFLFIGFAALCKQNYLIILPFTIFLLGKEKTVRNTVIGLLPIIFYISFISYFGGFKDLVTQLTGHNELLKVGVITYLKNPFIYIALIGILLYNKLNLNKIYLILFLIVLALILLLSNHYHGKLGFIFFGILLGDLIYKYTNRKLLKISTITLIISWCVSISVGYNSIALFCGGIISWLIFDYFKESKANNRILYYLLIVSLASFIFVRTHNIYRETISEKLTYNLDDIVEGAYGIQTNLHTFKVLVELNLLKKKYPNVIVIPDFTATNILHSHQSKVLTEWPNKTEIPNDKILSKVVSKIINDTTLIFAIPKYQTALLKDGLTKFPNNGLDYKIIDFVKRNYHKKDDYNYFEIYKK